MKLKDLAIKYGSDKHGHHDYCQHYENHIGAYTNLPITLLELGIGGYEFPDRGGAGMKMFRDFLPKAKIVGVDKWYKQGLDVHPRMKVYQGSQDDEKFLNKVVEQEGRPSIIIDDASHMNALTIKSFQILFPLLLPGGVYVIEDIESSWWEDHGFDGTKNLDDMQKWTTINMLRSLVVPVNRKYLPL